VKYIAPHLYSFENCIVGRAYLLEDTDELTIIDGSIPASTGTILRQITGSGRRLSDVRRILLTHAHFDHVGALAELKRLSGAAIICSALEQPIAEGKAPTVTPEGRLSAPAQTIKGITIDRTVNDGDVIDAFGGLQVIATPGHSPGQVAFYQPERKILFTGDTLMNLWGKLRPPFAMATPDMDEAKRSIQKLAAFDVEIACFGHGAPLTHNANATIRAFTRQIGTN
jgi:glyoxylase-like metal-dependent hydrolase (beta-lactamase superfamily II)